MAKPHQKKRRLKAPNSTPQGPPPYGQIRPRHSRKLLLVAARSSGGTYLFNSALDYALQHIWGLLLLAVGGPIVTAVGAIVLYLRSGQASWLWPWLTHLMTFWVGVLLLMGTIVVLAWRKSRQEKRELASIQEAKKSSICVRRIRLYRLFR